MNNNNFIHPAIGTHNIFSHSQMNSHDQMYDYNNLNRALNGELMQDSHGNFYDERGQFLVSTVDLHAYAQHVQLYGYPTSAMTTQASQAPDNITTKTTKPKANSKVKPKAESKSRTKSSKKNSKSGKTHDNAVDEENLNIELAEIEKANPFTLELYPIDQSAVCLT